MYVVEDMHTAYWSGGYGGGYRRPGSAIELVKTVVDDLHGWYHDKPARLIAPSEVRGVHFYDSIAVIEKGVKTPPRHVAVGAR